MLCPVESRVVHFLPNTQNSLAGFYIRCILSREFLMRSLKSTNLVLSLKVDLYWVEHSSGLYNSLKSLLATPRYFNLLHIRERRQRSGP